MFVYVLITGWGDLSSSDKDDTINELTREELIYRLSIAEEKNKYYAEQMKTKTVEIRTGIFEKKIIRKGNKKRQKMIRKGVQRKKLSLGYVGVAEVFCYPYDSFEKIFIRVDRSVATIDKYILPTFFRAHNRASWFLKHGKDIVQGKIESESPLAEEILNAFNVGVKEQLEEDKKRVSAERREMLMRLRMMKPDAREGFLQDNPELRKKYDAYIKRTGYTENQQSE